MRKITLKLDSLTVESFETAGVELDRGTVMAHEPTKSRQVECGSAFDACQTGLCTGDCEPTYAAAECPTVYPEYC
jgi:hypothetical protein